jgi:hypothetical protein
MLTMLLAYDSAGNVVATLDYMVAKGEDGQVIGLIDFEAYEAAGGKLRDIWQASEAVGSATWPEWIGTRAHDFRVELDGKRIKALVHKDSGHQRERMALEAAVAAVQPAEDGSRDIRHIVGGPGAALLLDDQGRNAEKVRQGTPKHLPVIGAQRG